MRIAGHGSSVFGSYRLASMVVPSNDSIVSVSVTS